MPKLEGPKIACPACGGAVWQGARYMPPATIDTRDPRVGIIQVEEALVYTCEGCNYQVALPTAATLRPDQDPTQPIPRRQPQQQKKGER